MKLTKQENHSKCRHKPSINNNKNEKIQVPSEYKEMMIMIIKRFEAELFCIATGNRGQNKRWFVSSAWKDEK